jgi:DNA invertase Pin-like site-specific DNA recombinase
MNGIIYCRVSSKEQIEGTSLQSQEAACREYARAKGIQVRRVFVEQGESAKFADRTELLELIDFCRKGKGSVEVLLVWKIDRFARNVTDHYSVKSTLAKFGVQIVSVTEPIDGKPEGKLMETILAGFAQFDNDIRAMRTVQGMRRKIQEGIFPWGPPYGYLSSAVRGEKKTAPDKADPRVFPLLQRAWKEVATGAYTQAQMGRLMASWNLLSPRSKSFSPQSIYQLFTNPFYAGILVDPWSGEEYPGRHPAMVSRAEFVKVQKVIAGRNRSMIHQKLSPDFPLRGLIRCHGCEHYLTACFARGRSQKYLYYYCRKKSCPARGKNHAGLEIHGSFEQFLDEITPKKGAFEKLIDMIISEVNDRERHTAMATSRRSERREKLNRELQELISMRSQNLITDEEFLRQKKTIADSRAVIESKDTIETVTADEIRRDADSIASYLYHLRATWTSLNPSFRRWFDTIILPAGFLNGKVRTAELGLLFSTFRGFATEDSVVVPFTSEMSNRIIREIQSLRKIFIGVEEEKLTPKWRFRHSHRNRPRMR